MVVMLPLWVIFIHFCCFALQPPLSQSGSSYSKLILHAWHFPDEEELCFSVVLLSPMSYPQHIPKSVFPMPAHLCEVWPLTFIISYSPNSSLREMGGVGRGIRSLWTVVIMEGFRKGRTAWARLFSVSHLMREEKIIHVEQWGGGWGKSCVYLGAFQVLWLKWQTFEARVQGRNVRQPVSWGHGEVQMQFIVLSTYTAVASRYISMEREWDNITRFVL